MVDGRGKRGEGRGRLKQTCIVLTVAILAAAAFAVVRLREYRLRRWIAAAPRTELLRYISSHPDQPDALRRLGILDRNTGEVGESAKLLQRAVEAAPGDEANWVELSRTLNDGQVTMQKLQSYLSIEPDSAQIMAELARRKLQVGDISTAASLASKAVKLTPDSPDAQRVMGDVAAAAGNWPRAESLYKRSLSLHDDPETRLALAHIWIPLQRYGAIIEICSPIVTAGRSPEISVEQRARALVYTAGAQLYQPLTPAEMANVQQQLREADALSERLPQAERFLPPYFMGESLIKSGSPKEAVPFLERSSSLAPMFAGSLYSLSQAYRLSGQTAKADAALTRHGQLVRQLTDMEKANDRSPGQ